MRLSAKSRFAVAAMIDLALRELRYRISRKSFCKGCLEVKTIYFSF